MKTTIQAIALCCAAFLSSAAPATAHEVDDGNLDEYVAEAEDSLVHHCIACCLSSGPEVMSVVDINVNHCEQACLSFSDSLLQNLRTATEMIRRLR